MKSARDAAGNRALKEVARLPLGAGGLVGIGPDLFAAWPGSGVVVFRLRVFLVNDNPDGEPEVIGELVGREAIAQAVTDMMKPHPPRGWSHNATDGVLVEIDGDRTIVDAQFMVFSILGDARPASGWPAGAAGPMGTITPIESGYYTQKLVRVGGSG